MSSVVAAVLLAAVLHASWTAMLKGGRDRLVMMVLVLVLVLWAQNRGQLAVVAALRETSVLVAALIGTLVFGERFGGRRVLAAGCITAGVVLLELAR